MLPLTGFNQFSFTTVKTNTYPHPLKHIWKRVVKNCSKLRTNCEDHFHVLENLFQIHISRRATPGNYCKIWQTALSKSMLSK